jgi:hypothetical protein
VARSFKLSHSEQKGGVVLERTEMTLLDRPIAAKLHKSLYSRGPELSPGFETDCQSAGQEALKTIEEPKTIIAWLTEFVRNKKLRSVLPDQDIDVNWAARGYIADLFSIVACLECTSYTYGPPPFAAGQDSQIRHQVAGYYTRTIPGYGVLIAPPKPVSTAAASDPGNSVDQLRASFIHSGPFKLKANRKLTKHLTFHNGNKLRVFQYWGNNMTPGEGMEFTSSLRVYRNHTLRWYSTIHVL